MISGVDVGESSTLSICFFGVGVQSFSFVLSDKAKALYSKKTEY